MSPTRRDVLKIAAALPTLGAALSRTDALAELAKPVDVVPELPDGHPDSIFDPASFASQADRGTVYALSSDRGISPAAAERADYAKARFDLIQLMPELEDDRLANGHPFVRMDECMWSIANASYWEGVRAGAAYENLRRAIVSPVQACPRCEGLGLVDRAGDKIGNYDRPHPSDVRTCPDCKGACLVAAEFLKGWKR